MAAAEAVGFPTKGRASEPITAGWWPAGAAFGILEA